MSSFLGSLALPVDFGVVVGILGTSLVILRQVRILGRDVVMARLFLVRKGTERITILLFLALLGLVLSNVFREMGLEIESASELLSLFVLLIALLQAARILGRLKAAETGSIAGS